MKLVSTKYRSEELEIMDSFELQGEGLETTLKDLENINRFLGGNKVTIRGIEKLGLKKIGTLRIVDIGCGSGSMLREIAKWARKKRLKFELTGLDANPHTIAIAEKASQNFPELSFKTQNVFDARFMGDRYDIICCTLTMHHFKTREIKKLLRILQEKSELGLVINDLQRSKWAYYLFRLFCFFFIKNQIAKNDGAISILRGFKKPELTALSKELIFDNYSIKWCWAFRYRWIILSGKSVAR